MRRLILGVIAATWLCGASPASATTYQIDKDHSAVTFKIRHLFSKVQGSFDDFAGSFDHEPGQPDQWKAEAVIQAASINTRHEGRDKHLRSADFFDVEKYPTITFRSTKVTDAAETSAKLHGMLTMHGVEKLVVLDLAIHGVGKDPWGNIRSGFTGTTTINRKEFGIVWNQALETGEVLLGDDVEITIEIEGLVKAQ